MAKIELFKNIFDVSEREDYTIDKEISISSFLKGKELIRPVQTVEVYNPKTQKTEFKSVEPETVLTKVFVNGLEETSDYIIKQTDLIVILVLPANKNWVPSTLNIVEAVVAVALIGIGSVVASPIGGYLIAGGISLAATAAIDYGVGVYNAYHNESYEPHKEDASEKNPSITGSKNQPLTNESFPAVIGTPFASPRIVGSPYNEFEYDYDQQGNIIFTDEKGELKSNILGSVQPYFKLLAVGYAPLFLKDIKLGELNLSHNDNKVLVGTLTHKTDSEGNLATEDGNAIENVNGEYIQGGEIGDSWNSNKVQIEISQFGENRNIYKHVVKQHNINVPLLYCYSDEYSEVAKEKTITWQGGTFPVGLRSNPIHHTDGVPWKIAVGIDIPNGLYETWQKNGDTYYNKIPMNLVIQWRPYYRYVKEHERESEQGVKTSYNQGNFTEKILYRFKKTIYSEVKNTDGRQYKLRDIKDKNGGNSTRASENASNSYNV